MAACSLALSSSVLLHTSAHADEWIGLEPTTAWTVGYRYLWDESDDSTQSVYLSALRDSAWTVDAQFARSRLGEFNDTFDSDDIIAELGGFVHNDVRIGMRYQFQGHARELEIEQAGLHIDWTPYPAFLTLNVSSGDLSIFIRDDLTDRDLPERVTSDIDSHGITVGWSFARVAVSASLMRYDYEVNVSALETRPLVQLLVKPAVLAQSGLLVDEQASVSLYYPLPKRDLSGHFFSTRSALDNSTTQTLQLDWIEILDRHFSLFFSLGRSDEEQDNWSFGAGLEWRS